LAVGYYERNEFNVALDKIKLSLLADPNLGDAYSMRGLIYMKMKETRLADENFQHALKLDPENGSFNNNYGWFLCQNGRPAESIAYFEATLKNKKYNAPGKAMDNAGMCSLKANNPEAAEKYFLAAFKFEPGNPEINANLAKMYYVRNDYERANFYIQRVVKTDVVEPDVLWLGIKISHKLGDKITESALGSQLHRQQPNSVELHCICVGPSMSEAASSEAPENLPTPAPVDVQQLSLGSRLARERESKTLTVEQVASQLNLAPRQIQALESNNYAALPGLASVRGFVRAYAKLLKIDPTPLVAMIPSDKITPSEPFEPKRNVTATPFSDNRSLSSGNRGSSAKLVLTAIVVAILALVVIILERMGGWPAVSQSLSSQFKEYSEVTPISASEQALPTSGSASSGTSVNPAFAAPSSPTASWSAPPSAFVGESPVVGELNKFKAKDEHASPALATVQVAVSPVSAQVATTESTVTRSTVTQSTVMKTTTTTLSKAHPLAQGVDAAPSAIKPVSSTNNQLVMKFREDSWVEVKAGSNKLIARLVKAGSVETVEIGKPAELTLGNAAGVDVSLRGVPLALKADAKNNVVRFNVK